MGIFKFSKNLFTYLILSSKDSLEQTPSEGDIGAVEGVKTGATGGAVEGVKTGATGGTIEGVKAGGATDEDTEETEEVTPEGLDLLRSNFFLCILFNNSNRLKRINNKFNSVLVNCIYNIINEKK
jgi:hypothetical protein